MSSPPEYSPQPAPPAENALTSTGVWFFSAVAGIALVLAAVLFLRSSGDHSWLRAAIGLASGLALVIVAERYLAASYRTTASALDSSAIGILYATVYSMHAVWALVPLAIAFVGMLAITAAAVYLATRRDSIFVALLGLIGGFVTAYLLSSTESYPRAVFAYLLALNIGIAWLVVRKRWWLLSALSVLLTATYEWAWALQGMTVGLFPLAAGLFALFAVIGAIPLWHRSSTDCPPRYRWVAVAAAHLPLLFAIYVASQPNYGLLYYVLFGFLLFVDAGLLAIVWRGGPKWLHAAGGAATLITFLVWLGVSYTHGAWPWLLIWLVLFIALYLVKVTPFTGLLFGAFIGIAVREPQQWASLIGTMLVILSIALVVTVKRGKPAIGAIAIALSCVTLMMLHPPLWLLIALHSLLLAALFAGAWISERHVLAILAIPFYVAMLITANSPPAWAPYSGWTLFASAVVPYVLFVAYALALGARVKAALAPYLAAGLASLVLFICAWQAGGGLDGGQGWLIGLVALAETVVMLVLLRRVLSIEPREPRVTLVASLALVFFNIALSLLLSREALVVFLAIEVTALVWLLARFRHPVLRYWGTGIAVWLFFRLAFDSDLFAIYRHFYDHYWSLTVPIYAVCGLAMFAAAYVIRLRSPLLQRIFSVFCLFELWFLINILIANGFHSANGPLNFDFAASQPAENVWYTVAWAVIATGLLMLSFLIRWSAARGAALALLVAAVVKCFLIDLPRLGGLYRSASLLGLGLSVAVVGIVLQRRWAGKSIGLELPVQANELPIRISFES